MNDVRIIQALRAQAWQRAKGELQAMLQTFHPGDGSASAPATAPDGNFNELDMLINDFIEKVEDNGLAE